MLASVADTITEASLVPLAQAGSPVSANAISMPLPTPPGSVWLPQPGATRASPGPLLLNEHITPKFAGFASDAPTPSTPGTSAGTWTWPPSLPTAATTLRPLAFAART